jgi:phosphoribosyl 1,2-cyclic phosphodiesterase
MGFPMFSPVFLPFAKMRIRGPVSYEDESLEQIIGSQLTYRYWPVRLDELSAHIEYSQIKETSLDLGDGLWVQTKYLNHPILCLGYRFTYEGKSIVTAYDNEPFRNLFPTDPADPSYDAEAAEEGEAAAREANENILWFYKDADVLIHDTQYTAEEYNTHIGWGHSSFEYAINAANKADVKKLILFHHDPNRTDAKLAELETLYRNKIAGKTKMEIFVAREGLTIEV